MFRCAPHAVAVCFTCAVGEVEVGGDMQARLAGPSGASSSARAFLSKGKNVLTSLNLVMLDIYSDVCLVCTLNFDSGLPLGLVVNQVNLPFQLVLCTRS
mmetsp:Transcript_46890/g.146972  ORF Transcript_46890/g.146972 Transcript_46890/m.146972 type:complete len:99 (-) Transcript_46890:1486-1782(-)